MNTLTIAVLVVCATMAFASAIPGPAASAVVGEPAEIFQAEESRHYRAGHGGGGYGRYGGNYGRGNGYGGGRGYGGRGGYGGYGRGK